MKKLLVILTVICAFSAQAQTKKELVAENARLKSQVSELAAKADSVEQANKLIRAHYEQILSNLSEILLAGSQLNDKLDQKRNLDAPHVNARHESSPKERKDPATKEITASETSISNSATSKSSNSSYGGGSVSVRGYYRKDGTYVRPHTRSTSSRRK
ncbi:MAG: hypothetical protein LBH06_06405 [Rikenellaceae bacterium]|jgi:hypothetical protein|nr:hypothetical protein [Rikenellaceae bacterium]